MKTIIEFKHVFVLTIPDRLEDGHLYITFKYNTAVHKCACGCGEEVVTPLAPNDWKLIYDGETISLTPSIGNWSFQCRSHYWIRNDQVVWAEQWSDEKVAKIRKEDIRVKTENMQKKKNTRKSGFGKYWDKWFK
jgi:hypothetical protein